MIQTGKTNETVVRTLKTAQDFTELLSLSELNVQMKVLGFLNRNLYDYQMGFFKSQLMDFEQMIAYIPKSDLKHYFYCDYAHRKYRCTEYKKDEKGEYVRDSENGLIEIKKGRYLPFNLEYLRTKWSKKENYFSHDNRSVIEKHYFLLDTENKKYYKVPKGTVDRFTFSHGENTLICNFKFTKQDYGKYPGRPRSRKIYSHLTTTFCDIEFDLQTNKLKSFETSREYSNWVYIGDDWSTLGMDLSAVGDDSDFFLVEFKKYGG